MADDNETGGLFNDLGEALTNTVRHAATDIVGQVGDLATGVASEAINKAAGSAINALNSTEPETPPAAEEPPAEDTPPAADTPPAEDAPPAADTPPAADAPSETDETEEKDAKGKNRKKGNKDNKDKPADEQNEKPRDNTASSFVSVSAKSAASEMAELNSVQVDTAFANSAFDVLGNLSFDKLIGEPIRAAVKAQRDMAKEALNYIKKETIITGKDGVGQIAYVTLSFTKDGKKTTMQIPLLTLIPYPSLSIQSMTYKFTAKVDANSGVAVGVNPIDTATLAKIGAGGKDGGGSGSPGGGGGGDVGGNKTQPTNSFNASLTTTPSAPQKASNAPSLAASLSSKPGSSALRESRYSVETTIDMSVTAGTAATPSGITKIMEILDTSTDVVDTDGVLDVSSKALTLVDGHAILRASYRDGGGVYRREQIKCSVFEGGKAPKGLSSGNEVLYLFSEKGLYLVEAGDFKELVQVS